MSSAARPVTAGGCVSSRNSEDVSWKVFPLVFLSPRARTLLGCDIALLIGRLMLGVVLFAHGWQKLVIKGIGGTYAWFQAMGIPLAIVATSFVTVVEFVGGALLLLGALTRVVVALHILVMIGAAAFVHISHGLFAQDGGWELVGVIAACELVLAATGAGRFSIDHLVHRGRQARAMPPTTAAPSPARALPEHVHESVTLPGQVTATFGDRQRLGGGPGGPGGPVHHPVHQPGDRDPTLFAKPLSAPPPPPKPR
jgi:putative oxidoreductase